MKKSMALASIALMAASLTACGDDGGDSGGDGDAASGASYCDLIKDAKDTYDGLDFTGLSDEDFAGFQSDVEAIQAAAPDDIKEQWGTLTEATQRLQEILADAGISLEDLSSMEAGDMPDGVDMEKLQTMMTELQEFTEDSSFEEASTAVQQNVQDECDIEMGGETDPAETN